MDIGPNDCKPIENVGTACILNNNYRILCTFSTNLQFVCIFLLVWQCIGVSHCSTFTTPVTELSIRRTYLTLL